MSKITNSDNKTEFASNDVIYAKLIPTRIFELIELLPVEDVKRLMQLYPEIFSDVGKRVIYEQLQLRRNR